jgi:ABC-type transport system involved in cytochrome c biogenesis ATPase subunit
MAAVQVRGLRKRYGGTVAVDGVSFEIAEGETFGIAGRNGAGKTTTVECLTGLRRPDGGSVKVLGLDPVRRRRKLAQRIGVQLQEGSLPDRIKVGEALRLFAAFYPQPADWRQVMARWSLEPLAGKAFCDLSGGQKQRLQLALALAGDPELVVLDELTTGRRQAALISPTPVPGRHPMRRRIATTKATEPQKGWSPVFDHRGGDERFTELRNRRPVFLPRRPYDGRMSRKGVALLVIAAAFVVAGAVVILGNTAPEETSRGVENTRSPEEVSSYWTRERMDEATGG